MENLVFDILLPKSKSITKGVFYRPPNQVEFMDLMVEKFSNFSLKDTEIYLSIYILYILTLIFFKTANAF